MCPRVAFPTVMHVQHKTGISDEQRQQAKGILKKPAVREISEVFRLHDGCIKVTVNTQKDLSE